MRKIICFIFVLMLIACLVGCSNASSSGSVWELADLIGQDDDFSVWIGDAQYHFHSIRADSEQYADAVKVLNGLTVSHRKDGEKTLNDAKNMMVLETTDHRVQYFAFNGDFTEVWVTDNGDFTPEDDYCTVYKVKDPQSVKRFFEDTCEADTEYDSQK